VTELAVTNYTWSGSVPDVAHLRMFGCHAWAKSPDAMCTKLEPALPSGLVGYEVRHERLGLLGPL